MPAFDKTLKLCGFFSLFLFLFPTAALSLLLQTTRLAPTNPCFQIHASIFLGSPSLFRHRSQGHWRGKACGWEISSSVFLRTQYPLCWLHRVHQEHLYHRRSNSPSNGFSFFAVPNFHLETASLPLLSAGMSTFKTRPSSFNYFITIVCSARWQTLLIILASYRYFGA